MSVFHRTPATVAARLPCKTPAAAHSWVGKMAMGALRRPDHGLGWASRSPLPSFALGAVADDKAEPQAREEPEAIDIDATANAKGGAEVKAPKKKTSAKKTSAKKAGKGKGAAGGAAKAKAKEDVGVQKTQAELGGSPLSSMDEEGIGLISSSGPLLMLTKPLPRVLIVHTGGTLGMDPEASYVSGEEGLHLQEGTGGHYTPGLQPGNLLDNLTQMVPELRVFANLDINVLFNMDSCRVGPEQWVQIAKCIHKGRDYYDAFIVVHGTDTMSYTAAALSLMLSGFRKPIVLTGSQLPLAMPRSDARQNLIDSVTCATAFFSPPHVMLKEVAVCFGGRLMRGNRTQKTNSADYNAFDSPQFPHLANLGVDVDWHLEDMLEPQGVYHPRFKLDPRVIRIPIVPGADPRITYGELYKRGVRGVVLEAFGVGNMPDTDENGWIPWLRAERAAGLEVYLSSQCAKGDLHPELYMSGAVALEMGVESGPLMTPECAVVKMMLCLAHPDIPLGQPLAGEL